MKGKIKLFKVITGKPVRGHNTNILLKVITWKHIHSGSQLSRSVVVSFLNDRVEA
jgi:hypothetical protein